jgi:hypothetical protein
VPPHAVAHHEETALGIDREAVLVVRANGAGVRLRAPLVDGIDWKPLPAAGSRASTATLGKSTSSGVIEHLHETETDQGRHHEAPTYFEALGRRHDGAS